MIEETAMDLGVCESTSVGELELGSNSRPRPGPVGVVMMEIELDQAASGGNMAHLVEMGGGGSLPRDDSSNHLGQSAGSSDNGGSLLAMSSEQLQRALKVQNPEMKASSSATAVPQPQTSAASDSPAAPNMGDLLFFLDTKWLLSPSEDQMHAIEQHFEQRLLEGQGEFVFELGATSAASSAPSTPVDLTAPAPTPSTSDAEEAGLSEQELEICSKNLESICERVESKCVMLRQKPVVCHSATYGNTPLSNRLVADFLIRKNIEECDFIEVRVAVVGNVDAGKSTLLGVLTNGILDDGRGNARLKLFRHKHEAETGRTSSVGNDILGFDQMGNVVNKTDGHGSLDWGQVCRQAAKVITFIDLAGHEKYLKTTIFGMTGHLPDFCMLMVGSNAGVIGMTKEHLGLALALNVPVFVVVTKIDMCPENVLKDTLKLLQRILKSQGCRKIPIFIQNKNDVVVTATNFTSERVCPIFQVSNVTGENLDLLKMFLNLLSARSLPRVDEPAEFQIDDIYSVPGVGTVVAGTMLRGVIKLNDVLLLGPDSLGEFQPVPIKSIQRKRLPVKFVRGGQTASFALKKMKRNQIRKGMVLVSGAVKPFACWEFEGEILVLHHPTTISVKYQAMVHCCSVRQTAAIIWMDKETLRTGDKATIRFRFIKNPEYVRPQTRIVFREGRTKAVGSITKVFHPSETPNKPTYRNRYAPKFAQGGQGSGEGSTVHHNSNNRFGRRRGGGKHKRMGANFDSTNSASSNPSHDGSAPGGSNLAPS